MGKNKKRKRTKIEIEETKGHLYADIFLGNITKDMESEYDYAKSLKEEDEADHVIDGYETPNVNHYVHFNDDLGIDQNDYEVEQERYAVESEDVQPIAVDRYFERFGKSRRTPR
jgi:hypothetical protein|tara:strand:- start:559 stop:900 length:342 start_codon:yes stop_codon:yes gene_type:complete